MRYVVRSDVMMLMIQNHFCLVLCIFSIPRLFVLHDYQDASMDCSDGASNSGDPSLKKQEKVVSQDNDESSYEVVGDSDNNDASLPSDENSAGSDSFEYVFDEYSSVDEIPLDFIQNCNSVQDLEQICKALSRKEDQKSNQHWEAANLRLSKLKQKEWLLCLMEEQYTEIEQENKESSRMFKGVDANEDDEFVLVPSDSKNDFVVEEARNGIKTMTLNCNEEHPLSIENLRSTIGTYSRQNKEELPGMPIKTLMRHYGIDRRSPQDRLNLFQGIIATQCVFCQVEEIGWILFLKDAVKDVDMPLKGSYKRKQFTMPLQDDCSVDSNAAVAPPCNKIKKKNDGTKQNNSTLRVADPYSPNPSTMHSKAWDSVQDLRRPREFTMEDYYEDPQDPQKRKWALDYIEGCNSKSELERIVGRLFHVVEDTFWSGGSSVQAAAAKRLNKISPIRRRDSRNGNDTELEWLLVRQRVFAKWSNIKTTVRNSNIPTNNPILARCIKEREQKRLEQLQALRNLKYDNPFLAQYMQESEQKNYNNFRTCGHPKLNPIERKPKNVKMRGWSKVHFAPSDVTRRIERKKGWSSVRDVRWPRDFLDAKKKSEALGFDIDRDYPNRAIRDYFNDAKNAEKTEAAIKYIETCNSESEMIHVSAKIMFVQAIIQSREHGRSVKEAANQRRKELEKNPPAPSAFELLLRAMRNEKNYANRDCYKRYPQSFWSATLEKTWEKMYTVSYAENSNFIGELEKIIDYAKRKGSVELQNAATKRLNALRQQENP